MPVIPRSSRQCAVVRVPCCVCGSDQAAEVASGQDYEYETTAQVFHFTRCISCGHLFLNPRPAIEELPAIYPPDYYSYNYNQAVHPVARSAKDWLDERKARRWLRNVATKAPRFLDVGCGDGRYLRLFQSWGVPKGQLWGTELDARVVEKLQGEGFQVRKGAIEAVQDLPCEFFDLIVMLQVIEHVADPAAVVAKLEKLLSPSGVLVIETPNVESLDFHLFQRRYWGGYHFPRHWNLFTPKTLNRLLKHASLQLVEISYLPAHTFWVYSIHHTVKYKYGFRTLARLLNPFRNVPLLAMATGFDLLRAALGSATSNMQVVVRKAAPQES